MGHYSDFLFLFAVFAAWFVLVRWVLPWLGISTCMCGACQLPQQPAAKEGDSINSMEKENEA